MPRLEEKHPLAIRWLHWINFPLLTLMIWSGLLIYWANDVYRIGWGETTLLHFFPDWVYAKLPIAQRLAEGMSLHFVFMWLFAINGVAYVVFLLASGEWKHVAPERDSVRNAVAVALHDLHLTKELPPQGKYNGAQKLAYSGVILMGFGSTVTGLVIYKPAQLSWLASLLGGYQMARWEHFWLMGGFVLFFVVHVAQVVRAGWGNFRSMIAGCDVAQVPHERSLTLSAMSPERELQVRTRRGFLTLAGGAVGGFSLFSWARSRESDGGVPYPFRRVLEINERLARGYFTPEHRSREYPVSSAASDPRVNGDVGLKDDPEIDEWKLTVNGPSGERSQLLTLQDILGLPKVEQVTELNCIEGWTEIVHWGGARFRDFTAKYAPDSQHEPHVGLQTPNEEYYVGLDMASALHPQTLLCYEMNGKPLTASHGAPLRLVVPVKYGIKNIKRIGKITYSRTRTEDYWAREGYDWYAGL